MEHDIDECSVLSEIVRSTEVPNPTPPNVTNVNDVMLQPDHPLLVKFQQVLKDQLERQIQKLSEEVHGLEVGIKKKEEERFELGSKIQSVQQITAKQHETIKQNEIETKNYAIDRMELEQEVAEIREIHKEKQNKLLQVEKKEKEISNEVATMNYLMKQMLDWENKLNSNLTVNKRISSKTKIDKRQVAREKRFLDFIVYKLMTEIYRLENNIEHTHMLIDSQEKEREKFAEMIATNKANMEMMESDHKRLLQWWNGVVLAIRQRDKVYNEAKSDLSKKQEELRNTVSEIEMLRKLCNEEMDLEEQLAMEKNKTDMARARLHAKLQSERSKIDILERELSELEPMLIQTHRDFAESREELRHLQEAKVNLEYQLAKQKNRKTDLERQMVDNLQGHVSGDCDERFLNKHIQEKRDYNRILEIEVSNLENIIANLNVEIEVTKRENVESEDYMKELADETKTKEKEAKNMTMELNLLQREVKKKQVECEALSKQYNELEEKYGTRAIKANIAELQKRIVQLENENRKLENKWLQQQNNLIQLSEKRRQQMYDLNYTRTINLFLLQEKVKLEDQAEELKKQEHETNKNMTNIKIKLDKLCAGIVESKDFQNTLNKENDISRHEYGQELKEIELECIKLETLVSEMDQQKMDLTRELANAKREILTWEANIHRTEEQKKQMNKEKGGDGELATMRIEIHRMTVRYSQLKKAQEKLIQDLNNCISRREFISTQAEALEKRLAVGGKVNNRATFQRKLEDMKTKLKKTDHEIKVVEKKLEEACNLECELELKETEQELQIKENEEKCAELHNNLEVAAYDRQKDLDILLFKQHKLSAYMNICKGFYKKNFRSMTTLENEFEKQQDINSKLQTVVENLLVDFPNHYLVFNTILNALKLPNTQ